MARTLVRRCEELAAERFAGQAVPRPRSGTNAGTGRSAVETPNWDAYCNAGPDVYWQYRYVSHRARSA